MKTDEETARLSSELEAQHGQDHARDLDRLLPLIYGELRALARQNRYRWRGEALHGTTSLVHEAYAKLAQGSGAELYNRGRVLGVASKAMRSILIDNARRHRRLKRGGGAVAVPLDEVELVSAERSEDLLALDDALARLERDRPELARVVECRVFGGLTNAETAAALEVSVATVKRRWSLAKAILYRDLRSADGGAGRGLGGLE